MLVVLGGCSSSPPVEPDDIGGGGVTTSTELPDGFASPTQTLETTQDQVEAIDEQLEVSPIDQALGAITDPEELSLAFQKYNIEWADFVTACVRAEGFDFTEIIELAPTAGELVAGSQASPEGLAEFGYGVTLSRRGAWLSLTADRNQGAIDEIPTVTQYVEGLEDDERDSFLEARAVCVTTANSEVDRPEPHLESIAEEIAAVRSDALASAEIAAVADAWTLCMFESGHQVADRDDIYEELLELAGTVDQFLLQFLGKEATPTESDTEEFEDLIAPLEEAERAVVAVDLACDLEVGLTETRRAVLYAAEEAWLEQHGDRVALLLTEGE